MKFIVICGSRSWWICPRILIRGGTHMDNRYKEVFKVSVDDQIPEGYGWLFIYALLLFGGWKLILGALILLFYFL